MSRWVLLCSGQGSQHAEMFERFEDEASQQWLREHIPGEVSGAFFPHGQVSGLERGEVAQPALALYTALVWRALRAHGVSGPDWIMGYSMGEFNACAVAGALAWETLVPLAVERARLMAGAWAEPTGLVALRGFEAEAMERLCVEHQGSLAIDNGPGHRIVGLERRRLEAFCREAAGFGNGICRPLSVEVAAHTPFLAAAREPFLRRLEAVEWGRFGIPVLSATSLGLVRSAPVARRLAAAQLEEPVRWAQAMEAAIERGATLFLEIGPGNALARMVREAYPQVEARSVDDFRTFAGVGEWLAHKG